MGKYWSHNEKSRKKISESAKKRYEGHKILVNCKYCNNKFETTKARIKNGRGKYCSKKCQYSDKKGKRYSPETEFKKGSKPKNYIGNKEICDQCGKEFEAAPSSNRKFCSRKCEHKFRETLTGDKAGNWQGGKTALNYRARRTKKYKLWRSDVFERDDYTCQDCGKRGGNLEAHHIKSFVGHKDLRYVISNGITYCIDCHIKNDEQRRGKGE